MSMELDREELYYCKLIFKGIVNELAPEEKSELDHWIEVSPCNRELYERFSDRSLMLERFDMCDDISVDLYLNRMIYYIHSTRRSRNKYWDKIVSLIVAGIASICTIYILLDSFRSRFSADASAGIIGEVVIQPGCPKALLVLNEVYSVQLTHERQGYLKEFGDTGIRIKGNSIDYTGAEINHDRTIIHKIMVPTGGEYLVVLSDGSRVFLNPESVLIYPASFGGDTREVKFEGEGYFEVAEEPYRPFIVNSKAATVRTLIAEFRLRAYSDEDYTTATLIAGDAQVVTPDGGMVVLTPSQQAVSVAERHNEIILSGVDAHQYKGFKDGKLIFYETRLEEVINTIRRWYDFEAIWDEKAKDALFSGHIDRRESIYSFLNTLETSGKIKIAVDNKIITFSFVHGIKS